MTPLQLQLSYCPVEQKPCIKWIQEMFKDCLCNLKDEVSFGFGIAGLVLWAVAEIPQIVTNFNNKSAAGVSLAFLATWIVGDVFNLVGCILEPATLPTQFYTALLYTTVTVILAVQCVYYNYIVKWWNCRKEEENMVVDETEPLQRKLPRHRTRTAAKHAPVEVPQKRDFYFRSARSLVGSDTPPGRSYIRATSGPPALEHHMDSSSEDEEGLIPPPLAGKPMSQPRPIPRPVKYGTFLAASVNLPRLSRAIGLAQPLVQEIPENVSGQWLGWLMAAIYMGGRIPQIWLNIKRGTVEGLNPWMFVFALMANATYVGSILVRTIEWRLIRANLPWLLDAIVCVFLDLLIILQYVFYKHIKRNKTEHPEQQYGDYVVASDSDKLAL